MKTLLLLLLVCSVAHAESPTFTSLQIHLGKDGDGKLVVDTRTAAEAHQSADNPKGHPVDLDLLGDADATKVEDGRHRLVYDFSRIESTDGLIASFMPADQKKWTEERLGIDKDEKVLVLKPDKNMKAKLTMPQFVSGPIDLRVDLLGHSEGMFQIIFPTSTGSLPAVITIHGQNSLEKDVAPGTINVSRRADPKSQFRTLLQISQQPSKRQEYSFKTEGADERMTVEIGIGSAVPMAVSRIELTAKLIAGFGIKLAEKGNRVLAEKVSDGSASAEAGLKDGDVLQAINGVRVKDMKQAMKLMADCDFGEEATLIVLRYGKEKKIALTPR